MNKVNLIIVLVVIVVTACAKTESRNLTVFSLFGDNMVLQRNQKIPVWGTGNPGEEIEVTFGEKSCKTVVGSDGRWEAKLGPLNLGEEDSLSIQSAHEMLTFRNVIVGDVWLCSGQSNMEMNVACTWAKVNNSEEEVANADYPNIRLFSVERNTSFKPTYEIKSRGWQVCSPETVGAFSAVGYFFGREILQTQEVPIGLIQSCWGGTAAEAWTSAESLSMLNEFVKRIEKIKSLPADVDSLKSQYQSDLNAWRKETNEADAGFVGDSAVFTTPEYDDSDWMKMEVPGMWEGTKIGAIDGVVWFRKSITIPDAQFGKEMTLTIAPPDDADETWFNGVKVGESEEWDVVRKYKIPAEIVRKGGNIVTVRLIDKQGAGGFMGKNSDFSLYTEDGWKINMADEWKCKVGYNKGNILIQPVEPGDPNQPTVLYNAMIYPISRFAMKGVIWYQGENNTGMAYQYQTLFPTLIQDWRNKWNQGNFPFLFVQLANYQKRNTEPVEDSWAELREAQSMALMLPNTGMAVTIDIGDADNIHPGNKQDVAKRLALVARNKVYGEDNPFSGPMYKSMELKGNKLELSFEYEYDGLSIRGSNKLKGFAVAGPEKKFYWADALIDGNKVVVWSPKVQKPVAVRYAWSSNPECNLINSAGLPASPFRTDNWYGITAPKEIKNAE